MRFLVFQGSGFRFQVSEVRGQSRISPLGAGGFSAVARCQRLESVESMLRMRQRAADGNGLTQRRKGIYWRFQISDSGCRIASRRGSGKRAECIGLLRIGRRSQIRKTDVSCQRPEASCQRPVSVDSTLRVRHRASKGNLHRASPRPLKGVRGQRPLNNYALCIMNYELNKIY